MLISLYKGHFYKPMQITKSEWFSLVVWGNLDPNVFLSAKVVLLWVSFRCAEEEKFITNTCLGTIRAGEAGPRWTGCELKEFSFPWQNY